MPKCIDTYYFAKTCIDKYYFAKTYKHTHIHTYRKARLSGLSYRKFKMKQNIEGIISLCSQNASHLGTIYSSLMSWHVHCISILFRAMFPCCYVQYYMYLNENLCYKMINRIDIVIWFVYRCTDIEGIDEYQLIIDDIQLLLCKIAVREFRYNRRKFKFVLK